MSTQPQSTDARRTDPARRTASQSYTTRDAPFTFTPYNTDPCPSMFTDKWTGTGTE